VQQQSGVLVALWRRWYLLPLALVATLGLGFLASTAVPAQYKVSGSILLLPAKSAGEIGSNPYLALGGLGPAASVLGRTMSDGDTARALKDRGATGVFTVEPDLTTTGPVLLVEVVASTPAAALSTLGLIVEQAPVTLRDLQRSIDVPERSLIGSTVINQDRKATVVRKSQLRAILVAGVAGAAGSIFFISLLDGFLVRRRRRISGRAVHADDAQGQQVATDPVPLTRGRPRRGAGTADGAGPRAASGAGS
jgi:hypothetical protein